jgi:hypothetical protein
LLAASCLTLAGCGGVVVSPNTNASLSINAQDISFGDIALNASSTQSIVLTSSGSAPVTITGSTLSGSGFTISSLVIPTTLLPGQSTTLNVQFQPTTAGSETGLLTLTTNSATTPTLQIDLTGAGTATAPQSQYQVSLTWNPPSAGSTSVAGYDVYRSTSGTELYELLNDTVIGPTSFTDADVQSGETYEYYVTTVSPQGIQSPPSNIAEVTIP